METSVTPARVTVVDVDLPFGAIVRLMVKWTIAAIPALLILCVLAFVMAAILAGIFGGLAGLSR
jgi:hypothetical protein